MGFSLNIRAFLFLLALSGIGHLLFSLIKKDSESTKWFFFWAAALAAGYLTRNVWLFAMVIALLCFYIVYFIGEDGIFIYFILLPCLPSHTLYEIPSFLPGVRYLFELTYPRLLAIFLLLPLLFKVVWKKGSSVNNFFSMPLDKLFFVYFIMISVRMFRGPSFTEATRQAFLCVLDIFLPYYVITRLHQNSKDIKKTFTCISYTAVLLALIGFLEKVKSWRLYGGFNDALHLPPSSESVYLYREGSLRVSASLGHPIAFGYFLAIGIGILFYLKAIYPKKEIIFYGLLGIFFSTLFFTVSRGPWVGCAVILLVLLLFRPRQICSFILIAFLIFGFSAPLLLKADTVKHFVNLLPFAKGDNQSTIDYRIDLLRNSIEVIKMHPWFGSPDYLQAEQMEEMRQGQGIIDVVNTYITVALSVGLTGLVLFAAIFIAAIAEVFVCTLALMRRGQEECALIGQTLLAILAGIVVILGTVSSIAFIPIYYWAMIALSSAYIRISQERWQFVRQRKWGLE